MEKINGDLDVLIQGKIEADNDFQDSLVDLSDEDRESAIQEKRNELVKSEFASVAEIAKKKDEVANNQKIRAEKAEADLKKGIKPPAGEGTPKNEPSAEGITTKDLYALMEAKVPEEDIDEIASYAKFQKISIAEALKTNVVKTILSDKAEQRTTASAANVGSAKRSNGKTPDDVLLSKAAKGELPENDADLERLIKLRKGIK